MLYKKIVLSIIASVLCIGLLNSCGYENEISIKIETYLQKNMVKNSTFVLEQPKLLPSYNGVIHATWDFKK